MCDTERTMVYFAFHRLDLNARFFLENGVTPSKDGSVDYTIIQNRPEWGKDAKSLKSNITLDNGCNVTWIQRPNISQDIGAYGEGVRATNVKDYEHFMFLNSSTRGPFIPTWYCGDAHWTQFFSSRLNEKVAAVGSTINYEFGRPHVQSMSMCLDRRAVDLYLKHGILPEDRQEIEKSDLIENHEIGGSQLLLKNGLNIDCLLPLYQDVDWREPLPADSEIPRDDIWWSNKYLGFDLHPYETIFFKSNRDSLTDQSIVNNMTRWAMEPQEDPWYEPYVSEDELNKSRLVPTKSLSKNPLRDMDTLTITLSCTVAALVLVVIALSIAMVRR